MTPEEIQVMASQIAAMHTAENPPFLHHREYWRLTIHGPGAGALAVRLNEQMAARHFDYDLRFDCVSGAVEGTWIYDAGVWHIDDLLLFFFGSIRPPFKDTQAEAYVNLFARGGTWTDCYPVSES